MRLPALATAGLAFGLQLLSALPASSEIITVNGTQYKVFALPSSTPSNLSSDELNKIKSSPWWGEYLLSIDFAQAWNTDGTVFAYAEFDNNGVIYLGGNKSNYRAWPLSADSASFAWGFLAPAPKPTDQPDNTKGALTSLVSCVSNASINPATTRDCVTVLASVNASSWEQLTAEAYASNLSVGLESMNRFRKNALAIALADNKISYTKTEKAKVCVDENGNALTASTKDQEVSKESTNCKTVKVTKKLPWSLVIDGTNTQASLRGTEDLGSLDYNIFQSTYGVEYALSDQFSIGGVFGYGQNNLYNYEFADTRVNSDTYSGGLYGLYKPSEPATIALLGGYSRFNSDSRRPIQFGTINRLAEADWNSNGYTVALTGEYAFTLSKVTDSADLKQKEKERRNAILLKPNALVSFAGYSQGLIEESGAQSLNLKLNPHTATSVIFGGGLVLQAPIVVSSESRLIPRLGVGYRYDVNGNSDEEHEVTGGFVELPEAGEIDVYGQNRGSNDVDVSLGLEYEISSNTAIYSNVAGSFWSNGNELTYGGGFRYSW